MDDNDNMQNLDFHQIINIYEEEKTIHFDQKYSFSENDSRLKFTEMIELKEEKKENKSALQFSRRSHVSKTKIDECDYMKPLVDDYMNCEHRDITNCRAIKRILHLLRHYDKSQTGDKEETRFSMHEYLLQFTYYTISLVMEDWYHCKKMHLINEKDIETFINDTGINCIHDKACKYLTRYQRDRSRDTFNDRKEEIDHNNIILMDQLDSIHSYIFHSSLRRRNMTLQNQYFLAEDIIEDDSESDCDIKEPAVDGTFARDLWDNKPDSISECNVAQIIYILNENDIMEKLKKLIPFRDEIIKYIYENKFDGEKIMNMKRKPFINEFAKHFNDNKLKLELGKLYNSIIKYDIGQLILDNEEQKQEDELLSPLLYHDVSLNAP
eukprot:185004_1